MIVDKTNETVVKSIKNTTDKLNQEIKDTNNKFNDVDDKIDSMNQEFLEINNMISNYMETISKQLKIVSIVIIIISILIGTFIIGTAVKNTSANREIDYIDLNQINGYDHSQFAITNGSDYYVWYDYDRLSGQVFYVCRSNGITTIGPEVRNEKGQLLYINENQLH